MSRVVKDSHGNDHDVDENNFLVDGVLIKIGLDEVIDADLEGFLDLISDEAGFPTLMQQDYEIEGYEPGNYLLLRVRGDVSMDLERQADEVVAAIINCASKASENATAIEALQFTQAAVNAANALACLQDIETR